MIKADDGQFSKELKQWRGSEMDADPETDDDDTAQYNLSNRNLAALANGQQQQPHAKGQAQVQGQGQGQVSGDETIKGKLPGAGHKRNSSEYSGDWAQ